MKRILSTLIYLLFFIAASAQQTPNFTIVGNIAGIKSGNVNLYLSHPTKDKVDSCPIVDGKFTLKGYVSSPTYATLFVETPNQKLPIGFSMLSCFVEAGEIKLQGDIAKGRQSVKVVGSDINDEFYAYNNYMHSLPEYQAFNKFSHTIQAAFLKAEMETVRSLSVDRDKQVLEMIKKIMALKPTSSTSHMAAYLVCQYAGSLPIKDAIAVEKLFDKKLTTCHYLNDFRDFIQGEQRLSVGKKSPDFMVKDLEGKEYTLKSFRGKYVFLEFSASWCGWCKKEVPHVRKAFHALEGRNVVFVTMNMDTKIDRWKDEITKENIEWMCLSNLEGMNGVLATSFNLKGLPASFVIDPDGKIIAKDLRGSEVLNFLTKEVK